MQRSYTYSQQVSLSTQMSVKAQSDFYSLAKFSSWLTQPDTGGFTAGEGTHTHTHT